MSDKERLDEFKEWFASGCEQGLDDFGVSKMDIAWVIEQAERAQELEDAVYATGETYRQEREYNQRLEKENARLRKALELIYEEEAEGLDTDLNGELLDTYISIISGHALKLPGYENHDQARRALEGEME